MSIQREVELFKASSKEQRRQFKQVSGIYGLVYDDQVIYIGQSIDIGRRIGDHMYCKRNINQVMHEVNKHKTGYFSN